MAECNRVFLIDIIFLLTVSEKSTLKRLLLKQYPNFSGILSYDIETHVRVAP